MKDNELVAIDFGSSRILAVAAEIQKNGAIKILAAERKKTDAVSKGLIEQKTSAAFTVNELQKLIQNSSKISNVNQVAVSINARSMRSELATQNLQLGLRAINEKMLDELVDECFDEARLVLDDKEAYEFYPSAYYIDGGKVENPIGKRGQTFDIDYNVVIGKKEIKTKLNDCFDRTGIVIEDCSLAVEALSTVLLEEWERKNGCAIINFGADTTSLAIYSEGILQDMLVVPFGARTITNDICELGISEKNAELLKLRKGVAMEKYLENPVNVQFPSVDAEGESVKISTRFLARIIEARLEEILEPIFFKINKFNLELEGGIVITGGGSKLNYILELIKERTQLEVRYGNHSEWLSDDVDECFFDPEYAQIIGTIVLANENRKNPQKLVEKKKPKIKGHILDSLTQGFINFFNDDENKQNEKKSKSQQKEESKEDKKQRISTVRFNRKK